MILWDLTMGNVTGDPNGPGSDQLSWKILWNKMDKHIELDLESHRLYE